MVLAAATRVPFFLANDKPYSRTGGRMIEKSLTIGNASKTDH